MLYLSKSQFVRGLQCPKSLWLFRHRPELRAEPDVATQARFDAGHDVGLVAQQLFPGGTQIAFERGEFEKKISATRSAMEQGAVTIYEATFSHDGVLVLVDILHQGNRGWEILEVKSTTGVKEHHIPDAAVQHYVLLGSGVEVDRTSIAHLNRDYVRAGEFAVEDLFQIEDVTTQVQDLQDFVGEQVRKQQSMLKGGMPEVDIGPQCSHPYDCDFIDQCWKHIPEESIFDLKGKGVDKFALYRNGIILQKDIPLSLLNPRQLQQVESTVKRQNHVSPEKVREFLAALSYPLCYLDFETVGTALPLYDGCRPYQQIPFQFSVHIQRQDGSEMEHHEFLADPGRDPRAGLLDRLLAILPQGACLVAYNAVFEKSILKELAELSTGYHERIDEIVGSFVDLMQPFKQRHVYFWRMQGSSSLKQVLPALVPTMSYDGMEIRDGFMAGQAFIDLAKTGGPAERERIRKALLEYCGQDTLGMVKIVERMRILAATGS